MGEWVVNEGWVNFVFECMCLFFYEFDNIYYNIDWLVIISVVLFVFVDVGMG